LVKFGSASRDTAAGRGLDGVRPLGPGPSVMRPIALGVGVAGGGTVVGFVRRFCGVKEAEGAASLATVSLTLRLRDFAPGADTGVGGGGGIEAVETSLFASAMALNRADFREAILSVLTTSSCWSLLAVTVFR
jgi:hypothetical protein